MEVEEDLDILFVGMVHADIEDMLVVHHRLIGYNKAKVVLDNRKHYTEEEVNLACWVGQRIVVVGIVDSVV